MDVREPCADTLPKDLHKCGKCNATDGNDKVICNICNAKYHLACVGLADLCDQWTCKPCVDKTIGTTMHPTNYTQAATTPLEKAPSVKSSKKNNIELRLKLLEEANKRKEELNRQ